MLENGRWTYRLCSKVACWHYKHRTGSLFNMPFWAHVLSWRFLQSYKLQFNWGMAHQIFWQFKPSLQNFLKHETCWRSTWPIPPTGKGSGYRQGPLTSCCRLTALTTYVKKGDKVVDLGCAPGGGFGSREEVRSSGNVIGMDLKPVTPVAGAIILQGSIEDPNMLKIAWNFRLQGWCCPLRFSTKCERRMGYRSCKADFTFHNCITVCAACAKSRRKQCVQGVWGWHANGVQIWITEELGKVLLSKPSASRQESSELYIICLDFKH